MKILNLLKSLLVATFLILSSSVFAETTITFYHYDLLGSPVATTNENGDQIWREEYSPWGEKLIKADVAYDNVRDYTGHVHDRETGLTYMQARYYDPQIGRFMGVDPVGFKENNPVYFNRYVYAGNNPYKFIDPNGENYVKALMAVGVAYSAYSGYKEDGMLGLGKELSGYNDRMDAIDSFSRGNYGGMAFSVLAIGCKGCKGIKNAAQDGLKNGGRFGDLVAKGAHRHHMPSKKASPLSEADGPAIRMDPNDHRETASYGGRKGSDQDAYRMKQKDLIDKGRFDDAFMMDVDDVQSKFGNSYDDAILEAMDELPDF